MATINIAGLTPVDDPSYRYKMPKIVAKVEGRGNGIKTLLVNVNEVGLSLNRDPPEIAKFFGCELGSQTSVSGDRYIVNGSHMAQSLQEHLCKYIEQFVLCFQCKLPETHYKIKNGIIAQKCLACGHKESVDMTHKLTTFILAQHKKAKESSGSKDKKDKKEKKKDKSASEDTEPTTPTEVVKEKKSKKDKKEKSSASSPSPEDNEDDANGGMGDTINGTDNEEAVTSEEIETDQSAVDACINRFATWYATNSSKGKDLVLEELRMVQTFASLHVKYRMVIFIGSLCTEALITNKEIITYKDYLSTLVGSNPASQRHLIAAFEWFCGSKYPSLQKFFPVVLKVLFDEELVEEDTFLLWSTDLTRNEFSCDDSLISYEVLEELRNAAGPFITWLQEAEEEDDDEEGDEDEEDDDESS